VAMADIEGENPSLKGVLYREFSRLALEPGKLGELMGIVARLKFDPAQHGSRDISARSTNTSSASLR
jgi:type I restriction enzyme M protein